MYHRVASGPSLLGGLDLALFRRQLEWLARHCRMIGPDDLPRAVQSGRSARPPVLLTFDDGYRCVHDLVYPVLREYGIPAVVFLATGAIDSGRPLWTDFVDLAFRETSHREARLPWSPDTPVALATPGQRSLEAARAKARLKASPDTRRQHDVAQLARNLGVQDTLEELPRQMLSWDEARAIGDLCLFAGHTHTHPIMSRVEFPRLTWEIRTCRDRIREELGYAPRWFAYPNGTAADFDARCRSLLQENGFRVACSTIEGFNGPDTDWMALKRLPTTAATVGDFVWLISGPQWRGAT